MIALYVKKLLRVFLLVPQLLVFTVEASMAETLDCTCVLETALCESARADEASGKQRVRWTQRLFTRDDASPSAKELSMACWRKRDVAPGGGEGSCCTHYNDERDAERYFKGTLR
jgi:hypothetical protein